MTAHHGIRIGIDLGGTKIAGIRLGWSGQEEARARVPTPQGDYAATVGAVAELVRELAAEDIEHARVGIGTPGAPRLQDGLMKNCNSTWLNGRPLAHDIATELGKDVQVANDADCFALSEAVDGAGAGAESVFGAILGTGVGAGLVINTHLVRGPNRTTGEWGHIELPHWAETGLAQRNCYCGRSNCIESFLCGPGLVQSWRELGGNTGVGGEPTVNVQSLLAACAAGASMALATMALYERMLAEALAVIINVLDPDVIVIGGGVSNVERLYVNVPPLLAERVLGGEVATRVVPAMYGDDSGVRGAAWL